MSDEERTAGPGGLLGLPLVVLDEALDAVPRLVARTRRQVDLARRLAGHLPCVGGLVAAPVEVPVPAHEVTPVDVLQVVAGDGDDDDRSADDPGEGTRNGSVVRTVDATRPPASDDAATSSADASDPAGETDAGPVPDSDDLPVPDYDALAASQVVPRLATLSAEELEAVRAYERAHRNRQTILSRVAQLLDG